MKKTIIIIIFYFFLCFNISGQDILDSLINRKVITIEQIPDSVKNELLKKYPLTQIISCYSIFDDIFYLLHKYDNVIELETQIELDRNIFITKQRIEFKDLPIDVYQRIIKETNNKNKETKNDPQLEYIIKKSGFGYYRYSFRSVKHYDTNTIIYGNEYYFDINGKLIENIEE